MTTKVKRTPENLNTAKFTRLFFDNFVRTLLGVSAGMALFLIADALHIVPYVFGAGVISGVIALILTCIQIFQQKRLHKK